MPPATRPYVPLRHHGHDRRVWSLMLELRRDTHLLPDGSPDIEAINRFATAAAELIEAVTASLRPPKQ